MSIGGNDDLQDRPVRYGQKIPVSDEELRYPGYSIDHRPKPRKRSRKGIIALTIVVVAVVIAGILVYSFMLNDHGNTPEEVFWQVIEAINENDGELLACCSTWSFEDEESLELLVEGWEKAQMGTKTTITVHSHELFTSDYKLDLQEELDSLIDHTEATYDVSVEESCIIIANCTTSVVSPYWNISRTYTSEMVVPLVRIDTSWYVPVPPSPDSGEAIAYPE